MKFTTAVALLGCAAVATATFTVADPDTPCTDIESPVACNPAEEQYSADTAICATYAVAAEANCNHIYQYWGEAAWGSAVTAKESEYVYAATTADDGTVTETCVAPADTVTPTTLSGSDVDVKTRLFAPTHEADYVSEKKPCAVLINFAAAAGADATTGAVTIKEMSASVLALPMTLLVAASSLMF